MEKESGKALILMINKNRLKIIKIFLNKNYLENYKIKDKRRCFFSKIF